MRRVFPFLLVLLLLFAGCKSDKEKVFAADADGYGVTDPETGVHYAALAPSFEPLATGERRGVTDGARPLALYAVADVDPARALADEEGTVYLAGDAPRAADLSPETMLLCERDAVSVVLRTFDKTEPLTAALFALWCEGDGTALPAGETPRASYAVRWLAREIPGLSFGVSYLRFAGGAYLYDIWNKRAVAVPEDTAAALGY